jgi:hypothetical protein
MSDPTGHAEAAMQLVVAALQHNSSTLQHVLPAVLQRAPEHTGALLGILQTRSEAVLTLGHDLGVLLSRTQAFAPEICKQQGHCRAAAALLDRQAQQRLRRLLLSPHCMPSVVALLLLAAAGVGKTSSLQAVCGSHWQATSSAGSSSSGSHSTSRVRGSSSGDASLSSARQRGQQLLSATGGGDDTPTPCQLQLFQLLGLDPQLTEIAQLPRHADGLLTRTSSIFLFTSYQQALQNIFTEPPEQQRELEVRMRGDQQRWRLEQRLCLLLPSALLPCTIKLLRSAAGKGVEEHTKEVGCVGG